jgi:hypothetical protein
MSYPRSRRTGGRALPVGGCPCPTHACVDHNVALPPGSASGSSRPGGDLGLRRADEDAVARPYLGAASGRACGREAESRTLSAGIDEPPPSDSRRVVLESIKGA